jgi:hypothetical protein
MVFGLVELDRDDFRTEIALRESGLAQARTEARIEARAGGARTSRSTSATSGGPAIDAPCACTRRDLPPRGV